MQHIPDALQRSHQLIRPVAMQMIHNCLEPTFAARLGDYRLHMMGPLDYGDLHYALLTHAKDPLRFCVIHFIAKSDALHFQCANCTEAAVEEIYREFEADFQHLVRVKAGYAAGELSSEAAHAAEERLYGSGHAI